MKIENNLSKFESIATIVRHVTLKWKKGKCFFGTDVSSIAVAQPRNGVVIRGISGNKVRPKFGLRAADNA